MPKIYEYFGLVFLIYTNEHLPIHVHVTNGKNESVIEILLNTKKEVVSIRKRKTSSNKPTIKELPTKELNTALKFVNIKAEEIVRIWKEIMSGKYKQKPLKITRKIT